MVLQHTFQLDVEHLAIVAFVLEHIRRFGLISAFFLLLSLLNLKILHFPDPNSCVLSATSHIGHVSCLDEREVSHSVRVAS
jgi:hypothetical protein